MRVESGFNLVKFGQGDRLAGRAFGADDCQSVPSVSTLMGTANHNKAKFTRS